MTAVRKRAGWTALVWLAMGVRLAQAQYATPVGTGAAKPKTLRATAVLEWTGPLEKPTASRLMPLAVWDGEHYQPAGLYLAQPAPLAFATDTQYVLEQSGEEKGLFDVREATRVRGDWEGRGRFQAEAPPPAPPKLKPSKTLPVLSNGKGSESASGPAKAGAGAPAPSSGGVAGSSTSADDKPTLHRRTGDDGASPSSSPPPTSSTGSAGAPSAKPAAGDADPDQPTLHRRSGQASGSASDPGVDEDDRDRPTLHRAQDRPSANAAGSADIDPDRPHLRHGAAAGEDDRLPPQLNGMPEGMRQLVGISDVSRAEPQSYAYHWSNTEDSGKMQAALAAIAEKAVAGLAAAGSRGAGSGSAAGSRAAASRTGVRASHVQRAPVGPVLVDERFTAYELSFSGGATLIYSAGYSAHAGAPAAQRVYVTLIAQPDFNGQPQVLLQQVSRGDRLDETPAMQLVDAVDTDGDQRAELIFQLTGNAPGSQAAPATGQFKAADPEASAAAANAALAPGQTPRQFAIYRVSGNHAEQVFTTGPLP